MTQAVQPWGQPRRNLSAERTPLTIAGKVYKNGVGVQATSQMWIALGRGVNLFKAQVGVDDIGDGNAAEFVVAVDGKTLWKSGLMHKGDAAKPFDMDVRGKSFLVLAVEGEARVQVR